MNAEHLHRCVDAGVIQANDIAEAGHAPLRHAGHEDAERVAVLVQNFDQNVLVGLLRALSECFRRAEQREVAV